VGRVVDPAGMAIHVEIPEEGEDRNRGGAAGKGGLVAIASCDHLVCDPTCGQQLLGLLGRWIGENLQGREEEVVLSQAGRGS
jgi:hypothetical protein